MPNLTDLYLPHAFHYKDDITTKSSRLNPPSPIDISQALQDRLSRGDDCCCSILSPVSLTHPNHWDPTPSPSLTPPPLPHHPPMKSTPLRCYLKSVKQDPSFQSAISLFRRWQKNHEDSDDYYCHMRFEDGKPCLSTEAESILSHSIPELSM